MKITKTRKETDVREKKHKQVQLSMKSDLRAAICLWKVGFENEGYMCSTLSVLLSQS